MEVLLLASFTVFGLRVPFVSHVGDRWPWVYQLVSPLVPLELGRRYWVYAEGASGLLAWLVLGGLSLLLFLAFHAARRHPAVFRLRSIIATSAAFHVTLALQPFTVSQDVFSYIMYGRIWTHYGRNPYTSIPHDFPFDPVYARLYWKSTASNYGPLWNWLAGGVTWLAGDELSVLVLAFRLLAIGASLACACLIWAILGRLSAEMRPAGTLLWAWNPLVLLETAIGAHNDVVMVLLLLAAIWLHLRKQLGLAFVALTLSALAKYVTAVLIPMYVLLLWRQEGSRRWRRVASAGALSAALAAALYAPFFDGWSTFGFARFGTATVAHTNSPGESLFYLLRLGMGEPRSLVEMPLDFQRWWVQTTRATYLFSAPQAPALTLEPLDQWQRLLVIEPQMGDWLHVYDPERGVYGYVGARLVGPCGPPLFDAVAPQVIARAWGAPGSATANLANVMVRLGLAIPYLLLAAALTWRVRSFDDFLGSGLILLLLSTALVWTFFFPWYMLWPLALACLQPDRAWARLTAMIATSVLLVYVFGGLGEAERRQLFYQLRGLIIFCLPLALFALTEARRTAWRWRPLARLAPAVAAGSLLVACAQPASPADAALATSHDRAGLAHLLRGAHDAAWLEFTRAIEADGGYLDGYYHRGLAELAVGDTRGAEDDFGHVIGREPRRVSAYLDRASVFEKRERFDLALRDYDRVLALEPYNAEAHEGRGRMLLNLGRLEPAAAALEEALRLDPQLGAAYHELAALEATRLHDEKALWLYDRAVELQPGQLGILHERAHLLERLGRPAEAAADFRTLAWASAYTTEIGEAVQKLKSLKALEG